MNYTIKSSDNGSYQIDGQEINATPIPIVSLSCLNDANYSTLFNSVLDGTFTIELNGSSINGVDVVSKLIQLSITGKESGDKYLDSDWSIQERASKFGINDSNVLLIDGTYEKRIADGQDYYRVKRGQLVSRILSGEITSENAFIIDQKIKEVRNSLLFGDWKSAKYYLDLTIVEGEFTQVVKDEYSTEIQSYIDTNY